MRKSIALGTMATVVTAIACGASSSSVNGANEGDTTADAGRDATATSTGDDSGGGDSGGGEASDPGSLAHPDGGSGQPTDAGPSTNSSPLPQNLPQVKGTCPTLATGNVAILGSTVQIWAGTPTASQNGSVVLYWHGTGSNSNEATYGFGQTQINEVTSGGGIVASFTSTTDGGTNTGNGVWTTGDFDVADQVVACAIAQLHADPRRIYVTGVSAGGLQTVWMAYARSGYIAAAAPISGGLICFNGGCTAPTTKPEDPSNTAPAMVIHGALGKDTYGMAPYITDFAVLSAAYEADVASKGGYSVDCNTGLGHAQGPPGVSPSIWRFFQDHPFKSMPEPYAGGLPAGFTSYCKRGPLAADGGPI